MSKGDKYFNKKKTNNMYSKTLINCHQYQILINEFGGNARKAHEEKHITCIRNGFGTLK